MAVGTGPGVMWSVPPREAIAPIGFGPPDPPPPGPIGGQFTGQAVPNRPQGRKMDPKRVKNDTKSRRKVPNLAGKRANGQRKDETSITSPDWAGSSYLGVAVRL